MITRLAPEWETTGWLNSDTPLSLAAFRGRPIVAAAFQMLCPGCVAHTIPQLNKVRQLFPADQVTVLGLHSVFEHHEAMREESLRAFLHEYKVQFPVAIDRHTPGEDIPLTMQRYQFQGTPTLMLIDRDGRLRLTTLGFAGDEQGDRKHHGGPEKAVHHYPRDHYAYWRAAIGDHAKLAAPGAFGENLAIAGLTERDVAVGDRFRLGSALIEASQGRQPCFRLNLRFELPDMALRMQQSGRTGWYYRIVEEGEVRAGDTLDLVERRLPDWTIERLWRNLYVRTLDREELLAMAAEPLLPERWRDIARRRLQSGDVEDWTPRLRGA
ncbi:MOSC domain-containing protein [Sphingoaurantiacus capsulatus]|uniref:MOSC domain-containing protein n=1 Tax=Sphingoaurantiacus capsulatus TaxID=1771310 RepID=A0ABV7X9P6_9SPHN